jgi:hypothetical protein
LSKLIHYHNRGKKQISKNVGFFYKSKIAAQSKQSPIEQNVAHSVHPACVSGKTLGNSTNQCTQLSPHLLSTVLSALLMDNDNALSNQF